MQGKKQRFNILPIQHPDLWDFYKKQQSLIWKAEDIDLTYDQFGDLDISQQEHLKMLLCFFSVSDAVVSDNLAHNFIQADIPEEAAFFYSEQIANENVHNETYGRLIQAYMTTEEERELAFNAATEIPTVKRKMDWAYKWIDEGNFAEKMIAFAAVEAILFSTTFAGIFAYKALHKNLPGLYHANTEISRDERLHYDFAIHYYTQHISEEEKLAPARVSEIINEAYEVEKQFIEDCFVFSPKGLSKDSMVQYLQYVVDVVRTRLGLPEVFSVEQPFAFMRQISIKKQDNFFEGRSSQYGVLESSEWGDISVSEEDEDF